MENGNGFSSWPHLLLSGFGCRGLGRKHLNDLDFIYSFLYDLPEKIGMQRLGTPNVEKIHKKHHADPGISGTAIIFTSHISIHTFPEGQLDGKRKPRSIERKIFTPFFSADVYSCKEFDIEKTIQFFLDAFDPQEIEKHLILRLKEDSQLIRVKNLGTGIADRGEAT